MSIDWNNFTPGAALAGGVLIGLAAAMFALLNGRIAGVSGIVGGLLKPTAGDRAWRIAFVGGLVGAPVLFALFGGVASTRIQTGFGPLIAAGVLVGIGTRYGSGCTSGHGVCGVSRLSLRSIVATLSFMATGFLAVFFVRHLSVF